MVAKPRCWAAAQVLLGAHVLRQNRGPGHVGKLALKAHGPTSALVVGNATSVNI
jgi:hypothetical protein